MSVARSLFQTLALPPSERENSAAMIKASRRKTTSGCRGRLIQWLLSLPLDGAPPQDVERIRAHFENCNNPNGLSGLIQECFIRRTWSAAGCNIRCSVSGELQPILSSMLRCLVSTGCELRFGAPPRSSLERNTADALLSVSSGKR